MLDKWALRNSSIKKQIALALYERRNLESAECLHALSSGEAEDLRSLGLRGRCAVVPNGVDLPPLRQQGEDNRTNRGKTLLYLGRIHPKKGLAALLRAWSVLGRDRGDWQLVVAGWSELGHEEDLKALGVEGVRFLGPVSSHEKWRVFRDADVFVLPSLSEGLPMAVLEAWASSLPVIMTRACNLSVGFREGAAMEVEPSVESLVVSMRSLVHKDPLELEEMGAKGRQLVEAEFSWSRVARKMLLIYDWMAGRAAAPPIVEAL
jgi:poly(glycerol-phosphate) alpha-glucosyltransferase